MRWCRLPRRTRAWTTRRSPGSINWIRRHTLERFGPVRSVQGVHVFELGFEAVNRSTRHKSGIAVRFPADPALAP